LLFDNAEMTMIMFHLFLFREKEKLIDEVERLRRLVQQ